MAEANTNIKARRLQDFDGSETAIVSELGNYARITGEVYPSNILAGMWAVDTEFGTLYLDEDQEHDVAFD